MTCCQCNCKSPKPNPDQEVWQRLDAVFVGELSRQQRVVGLFVSDALFEEYQSSLVKTLRFRPLDDFGNELENGLLYRGMPIFRRQGRLDQSSRLILR